MSEKRGVRERERKEGRIRVKIERERERENARGELRTDSGDFFMARETDTREEVEREKSSVYIFLATPGSPEASFGLRLYLYGVWFTVKKNSYCAIPSSQPLDLLDVQNKYSRLWASTDSTGCIARFMLLCCSFLFLRRLFFSVLLIKKNIWKIYYH